MGAIRRIEELLLTGLYEVIEVRMVEGAKGGPVSSAYAAVLKRVSQDTDDTYETILVELKDLEEQAFARSCVRRGPLARDFLL